MLLLRNAFGHKQDSLPLLYDEPVDNCEYYEAGPNHNHVSGMVLYRKKCFFLLFIPWLSHVVEHSNTRHEEGQIATNQFSNPETGSKHLAHAKVEKEEFSEENPQFFIRRAFKVANGHV